MRVYKTCQEKARISSWPCRTHGAQFTAATAPRSRTSVKMSGGRRAGQRRAPPRRGRARRTPEVASGRLVLVAADEGDPGRRRRKVWALAGLGEVDDGALQGRRPISAQLTGRRAAVTHAVDASRGHVSHQLARSGPKAARSASITGPSLADPTHTSTPYTPFGAYRSKMLDLSVRLSIEVSLTGTAGI